MKILVTGGLGFVGSNLIKTLLKNTNNKVICFDILNSHCLQQKMVDMKTLLFHPNFTFIQGDICQYQDIEKLPYIDTIIHLAAKTNVSFSIKNPLSYYQVNVNGTQNLLEFAGRKGIKQFIFASSSSVYGVNPSIPWKEDDSPDPISPYAVSKLRGEKLGLYYSNNYNIRFISLRLFNVYGPNQREDLVIHKFFKGITSGYPIQIYGNGHSCRDYTYITDIIQGIKESIEYNKSNFEIINLGGQGPVTLINLIEYIEKICAKKATLQFKPNRNFDPEITYASSDKAKYLLNYEPKTTLFNGLSMFYEWYYKSFSLQ